VGGWTGLTVAAFFAGVEFGIQPMLFHSADGTPLYAPYPLSVSIPAMVIPHALIASVVEGLVTGLVVAYLVRADQSALAIARQDQVPVEASGFARWRALWIALAALVLIVPVGLLAPGTAWGEWGTEQLSSLGLDFIPKGMEKLSGFWAAPMHGYNLSSLGNARLGYILSAAVGILFIVILVWLFTMLATARKPKAR
jgi:cobalt/nickel transport system permease protein